MAAMWAPSSEPLTRGGVGRLHRPSKQIRTARQHTSLLADVSLASAQARSSAARKRAGAAAAAAV